MSKVQFYVSIIGLFLLVDCHNEPCLEDQKLPHAAKCYRYKTCLDGKWKLAKCPRSTVYDIRLKKCIPGECRNKRNTFQVDSFSQLNDFGNLSINQWLRWQAPESKNPIQLRTPRQQYQYRRDIGYGNTFYPANNNQPARIVHRTYKHFRSSTTTFLGKSNTTIWYYNSDGPNYKFDIPGMLPVHKDHMIAWIEQNSHLYHRTQVPYQGDAPVQNQNVNPVPTMGPYIPPPTQIPPYTQRPPNTQRPPPNMWYKPPATLAPYIPPTRKPPPPQTTWYTPATQVTYKQPIRTQPPQTPKYQYVPTTKQPTVYFPTESSPILPLLSLNELLPDSCGLFGADKILGGNEVPIMTNPWQVGIVDANTRDLFCGGTTVSKYHVLTAAHCFKKSEHLVISKSDAMVYAGDYNIHKSPYRFRIRELIIHTKYHPSHRRNDIALILIDGAFTFNANVQPICLPDIQSAYRPNKECRISGWGKRASESSNNEDTLRAAIVKIVDDDLCKRENGKLLNISRGMFCAGDYARGEVDTCQGDSGGPCACEERGRGHLYGITSWGIGCGRANHPGIYVRVREYLSWIHGKMRESVGVRNKDTPEDDIDIGGPQELHTQLVEMPQSNFEEDVDIV